MDRPTFVRITGGLAREDFDGTCYAIDTNGNVWEHDEVFDARWTQLARPDGEHVVDFYVHVGFLGGGLRVLTSMGNMYQLRYVVGAHVWDSLDYLFKE